MLSPSPGLLSTTRSLGRSLSRGGSGSFRTSSSRSRTRNRRLGWTALVLLCFTCLGLQLVVSDRHYTPRLQTSAPRYRQDTAVTIAENSALPPSARPDYQTEEALCANSSEDCAVIQQAKQKSYQQFRAQQLASELTREQETGPNTLRSRASTGLASKRKGLQLFQLLTSRFRRRAKLPECIALEKISPRLRTIAIVGNGPISIQQRQQIQQADVVIRFNKLNNRSAL